MKQVFAPGCALVIYKPHLAKRIGGFLNEEIGAIDEHITCCHHAPNLPKNTQIINVCAGCDRRYRSLYEGISTVSLWEVLAESQNFEFPNYDGMRMSIHDACPTRTEDRVHTAVRTLLRKMNIEVVEPRNTRKNAICCGDSFYGILPVDDMKKQMKKRADEMACEDVAVYCVSCIKAMHIGGKTPRYLVDLLFGEDTTVGTFEPDLWHKEINEFTEAH